MVFSYDVSLASCLGQFLSLFLAFMCLPLLKRTGQCVSCFLILRFSLCIFGRNITEVLLCSWWAYHMSDNFDVSHYLLWLFHYGGVCLASSLKFALFPFEINKCFGGKYFFCLFLFFFIVTPNWKQPNTHQQEDGWTKCELSM